MKSVVQYFQETYGFAIQHTYLPCLQVGNQQRPNYLPMEVNLVVDQWYPFFFFLLRNFGKATVFPIFWVEIFSPNLASICVWIFFFFTIHWATF